MTATIFCGGPRRRTCARCGTGRCRSAPNSRERLRVLGRVRVGADLHASCSSSAHSRTVSKASPTSGSTSGTSSFVIVPLVPSIAIRSPGLERRLAHRGPRRCRGRSRAPAPVTAGTPMPRATSAAWLALPPSLVSTPFAAWKPATSSASVNGRTRMTSRPSSAAATASAARNTISPTAAPGDAATPRASTSNSASGSNVGCSSASRFSASIVSDRLLAREQLLLDRVDREAHGRLGGPLGVARLEHVEAPLLHGELRVLHVLVVAPRACAGSP